MLQVWQRHKAFRGAKLHHKHIDYSDGSGADSPPSQCPEGFIQEASSGMHLSTGLWGTAEEPGLCPHHGGLLHSLPHVSTVLHKNNYYRYLW